MESSLVNQMVPPDQNMKFPPIELQKELLELLEAKEASLKYRRIDTYYQPTGVYNRYKYPIHTAWMDASANHSQLAFVAANRTGKTLTAACLMAYHLTGEYPPEYKGRRFLNPVDCWAAGNSIQTTVEVIQVALFGDIGIEEEFGTGTIPKASIIGKPTRKQGAAGAIETARIRHKSGGVSRITFKSFDQDPDKFQGTKKHVIWLDEEPRNPKIYSECLMRTADKYAPGVLMLTFTPLFGMTDIVLGFLNGGKFPENGVPDKYPDKYVAKCTWWDVPHLTKEWIEAALASLPPHERAARSKGDVSLSAGMVYPFPEEEITCEPIAGGIPDWWPRVFGMDVGVNKTSAVWLAIDPDSRNIYAYREYDAGQQHAAIHASTINYPHPGLPGVVDPTAKNRSPRDGLSLLQAYKDFGLNINLADNSLEAGIQDVRHLLESGQLKIYNTLTLVLQQIRTYARDENGKIQEQTETRRNDLLDALRYAVRSGLRIAAPVCNSRIDEYLYKKNTSAIDSSLGRNKITGY